MVERVAGQVKRDVDVVVVGSGPVGSAFARAVHERAPATRILMLEAGPGLTDPPGLNVKNLDDEVELARARERSQGPPEAPRGAPARTVPTTARASARTGCAPRRRGRGSR